MYKKQFRLFDIYQLYMTKIPSLIQGIDTNSIVPLLTGDELRIQIVFLNGYYLETICKYNELDKMKKFVTTVNLELGNCRKPGRRKVNAIHSLEK